jgi:hypothetical protein
MAKVLEKDLDPYLIQGGRETARRILRMKGPQWTGPRVVREFTPVFHFQSPPPVVPFVKAGGSPAFDFLHPEVREFLHRWTFDFCERRTRRPR